MIGYQAYNYPQVIVKFLNYVMHLVFYLLMSKKSVQKNLLFSFMNLLKLVLIVNLPHLSIQTIVNYSVPFQIITFESPHAHCIGQISQYCLIKLSEDSTSMLVIFETYLVHKTFLNSIYTDSHQFLNICLIVYMHSCQNRVIQYQRQDQSLKIGVFLFLIHVFL